jgi:hypothetical protein
MGADDGTGDDPPEKQGWRSRRRAKKDEKKARKRAEREERAAAERDEQYRKDLEVERMRSEGSGSIEERMRRAVTLVRREGYKVALIYAAIDAALATLGVNLLLQVLRPDAIPATLPWPTVLFDAIVGYTGAPPGPLQTSIVAGLGAGVLVFVGEFVARTRRPLVEQFEEANPEVREALRTARDTVRDGTATGSRMTVALYEDVLARLRRTSSVGLVNVPRVFVTVLVIAVVSVASIQVAVVGLDLTALGNENDDGALDDRDTEYEGLQDANSVLGDPEDVTAGEETLNTTLATEGGGDDGGNGSSAAAYDSSGFSGTGEVEGQEAGFAENEQLEDAELIREYNLRIRAEEESDT